jgi:cytoskeletal protein CcmA (bactofilin family)
MPAGAHDEVQVICTRCGHPQPVPPTAFSTVCKKCGQHLRVQELLHPRPPAAEPVLARKRVTCFDCGTELEVAASAESTMCKRCSSYVDMHDYHISSAVSKNFKTKGVFVVEPKGYVFNTEALVGDAILKGRFLGKLAAERSLTIYSSAEIKGSFKAGRLIIPAANHFRWHEPVKAASADIAGELAADLQVTGAFVLRSGARFFGNARAGDLIVEDGAVVVGNLRIGPRTV